jgi:AraC-like DNA-binding protein
MSTPRKGRTRWLASDFRLGAAHFKNQVTDVASLPHTHGEYALVTCLEGTMEFICEDEYHMLEPGDMLMHNPGQVHQSRFGSSHSSCNGIILYFDTQAMETLLRKIALSYGSQLQSVIFLGKHRDLKALRLAQEMIEELDNQEVGHEAFMEALVTQMLVYLFRNCLTPTFVDSRPPLPRILPIWEMTEVMEYIYSHRKNSFSLEELCAIVGTSYSRLIPLFRNSTGLNPHAYFDRILIKKAQLLLQHERYPVKEAAFELGFEDVSYFCRIFRSLVGISPNTFRQMGEQQRPDPFL